MIKVLGAAAVAIVLCASGAQAATVLRAGQVDETLNYSETFNLPISGGSYEVRFQTGAPFRVYDAEAITVVTSRQYADLGPISTGYDYELNNQTGFIPTGDGFRLRFLLPAFYEKHYDCCMPYEHPDGSIVGVGYTERVQYDQIVMLNIDFGQGSMGEDFTVLLSAVPEPTTWALMIAGFGLVGSQLRRGRSPGMLSTI